MENISNKNMNPIFTLKNFRSFGEDGADFELAPITVLTGCNSAGKSSLVKALMLLSASTDSSGYVENLKISSKDLCLGGYKNVSHKDGMIIMSYKIRSVDLQEILVVTRKFCAKRYDELNDGALYHLTVEKLDGTLIYQVGPGWVNGGHLIPDIPLYDSIVEEFNRFYSVGCYMYFKEVLLPIFEHEEKEQTNDSDISLAKRRELASNKVKERLESTGITEHEAALLWREFNHNTFDAIIKSMSTNLVYGEKTIISVSDIIKTPEADEMELMLKTFINHIVDDACSPFFTKQPVYINSASAQIERLYTIRDDNKMSNALRKLNSRKIQFDDDVDIFSASPFEIHKPGSFINKWLDVFEIGKSIEVKGTDQGLGLMAYLNKGKEERLLADEGYGITQLIALLLQIDNSIPIWLECVKEFYYKGRREVYNYEPMIICVEEPEVHLHPKYQSLLAEMFVEAYQKYNIHFIIETHSEYLIRKLQVLVADKENKLTPNDVSLNYVEKDENGVSHNRPIKIQEDGRLSEPFGPGFFDEATGLSMHLLKMKMEAK